MTGHTPWRDIKHKSDEAAVENTGFSHDQIQERDGSIHAPDDFFFRERLTVERRALGPIERADHILAGYGGSFSNPLKAMEDARGLLNEAYREVGMIMDVYETLIRGAVRDRIERGDLRRELLRMQGVEVRPDA